MDLVTGQLARAHLRVEADYPDDQVLPYLAAAIEVAQQFMGRKLYADQAQLDAAVLAGTAAPFAMVMTAGVRAAILLILGNLHDNREDAVAATAALGSASRALLQPYRVEGGL